MKIKIVKNAPLEDLASDITGLIGKIYEVVCHGEDEIKYIATEISSEFGIYKGEYEIVEE